MKKKQKVERVRNFIYTSYMNHDDVLKLLINTDNVSRYAFIYHDKDIDENGKPEIPHYHLVITYHNARTSSACVKDCDYFKTLTGQNTRVKECLNLTSSLRYLMHLDDKEKYQYKRSEVSTNFDDKYFKFEINTTEQLLDDLNNGLTLREMARKYGRDFVLNREKYVTYADEMFREERFLKPVLSHDCYEELDLEIIKRKTSNPKNQII